MSGPFNERFADDRDTLLRRMKWERTGVRLLRLVISLVLVGQGAASLAGVGDLGWSGVISVVIGLSLLWGLFDSEPDALEPPSALSTEQREALAATIQRDGRFAAVKQLRGWTHASFSEASRDIDAAFPEAGHDENAAR